KPWIWSAVLPKSEFRMLGMIHCLGSLDHPNCRVDKTYTRLASAYNQPLHIDSHGLTEIAPQRPEIDHRAFLPKESMPNSRARRTYTDHLAALIDAMSLTVATTQCSKIYHPAVFPDETMASCIPREGGVAHDLSRVINPNANDTVICARISI